ncbi:MULTISPECIES: hypothetical protein [unclassified Paenibacillus]|uniref:hypothetical protein n=1 Tax=unclassified Paenibacillus TaxID=185978 RepID=UPI0009562732|nr:MULTISPECIES: hypothetical protein [unclassified Paenibacillus]ASS65908.1 hypothetical protein CIC07_06940 [Paenibacillus sp. RUD330]SIQ19377.1 hypothetical protein SAMN05880555_0971 [Paenibacillus sp. RU4X]SIQ40985.1 hypothetical protein SAMN05880570_0970 [Paenibacillus sp. RU4T]
MRAMMVVGWIVAPFLMLPARWKKLPGTAKAWGGIWTAVLLAVLAATLLSSSSGGNPAQTVQAKAIRAQAEPAVPGSAVPVKDGGK